MVAQCVCLSLPKKSFPVMSYLNLTSHVFCTMAVLTAPGRQLFVTQNQDVVPVGQLEGTEP